MSFKNKFFLGIFFLCALGQVNAKVKISNGTPAEEGQFPFFVGLTTATNDYRCGGTLIDADTVLTAAHCVAGLDNNGLTANIGAMQKNPMVAKESITVGEIIIHPDFSLTDPDVTGKYDIALLKLAKPAESTEFVELKEVSVEPGAEVIAAGMGRDENNIQVNNLMYTGATILPWKENCDSFSSDFPPTNFDPDMHLCISSSANGGDSGGPFMNYSGGAYFQVGLVSRSQVVTEQATRISYYYEWIKSNM